MLRFGKYFRHKIEKKLQFWLKLQPIIYVGKNITTLVKRKTPVFCWKLAQIARKYDYFCSLCYSSYHNMYNHSSCEFGEHWIDSCSPFIVAYITTRILLQYQHCSCKYSNLGMYIFINTANIGLVHGLWGQSLKEG
jgi:hypothetical protein